MKSRVKFRGESLECPLTGVSSPLSYDHIGMPVKKGENIEVCHILKGMRRYLI